MHPHPFQESFWSPTASVDTIPNFSYGLNVLHQKLRQSTDENQAIIDYLQCRIKAEEAYAERLATLATTSTAFEKDLGAGLKKCFEVVCGESTESAQEHRTRAGNLVTTALDPLQRFAARYQRIITQTKAAIDRRIGQFESLARTVGQTQAIYNSKCNALQQLCPGFRAFRIGPRTLEREKLVQLLDQMQTDLLLSLTGRAILHWVKIHCCKKQKDTNDVEEKTQEVHSDDTIDGADEEAMEICRDLMSYGCLTTVASQETTRSNTFDASETAEYTIWKPPSDDGNMPVQTGTFTGLLGRWSGQKNQDEIRRTMIHEMNEADIKYREAVEKAEKMRMAMEEVLFMHYEEMESLELERIQTIKQVFISVAAALSNTIPLCKEMYDRMMLYQETFQPDKDVHFIVEQYHTGRFCPRPMVYVNHFYGSASDQVFGVPLEDYAQAHKTVIPPLITHALEILGPGLSDLYEEEKRKVWTSQLPLDQIHAARERINRPHVNTAEHLKTYDLLTLACLIRLYFMELPECLLTFELYEPMKALYSNHTQTENERIITISKLLSTLPSANYYTLKLLMEHFYHHLLVRPQVESTLNLHERHPQRLVRDLIRHVRTVFSEEAVKAHEDHVHRRVIVAATATATAGEISKEPSLEAPSFASSASSSSTPSSIQVPTPTVGSLERAMTTPTTTATTTTTTTTTKNDPIKPATPTRRRTLLSFMRRSSSEHYHGRVLGGGGEGGGGGGGTAAGGRVVGAVTCRPIPIPSSSTLFEDPDELNAKSHTHHIPARPENEDYLQHHRSISLSTIDTADQSGLDSFFDDEDG
ncbi:hypothetical protein EC973_008421 [Apophysomyces ossiformis]|uniref:Uncharacterized protein n=1 Tax=Apophysomyces ossiformis TaxID=679940 RepID=A0A8H7BL56_9FUNG|nr:hypothetical protein EC973_008421 [Apophysomyces ossiformis]